MKKTLLIIFTIITSLLSAQDCSQLFFSEYVEGTYNNKALEIYNPTANTIDLSAYAIARYSNGLETASTTQLEGTIEPFSTFVIGLDKRNPEGTGLEAPMWTGSYTYIDSITNEEVTTPYNEDYDLQSKIDLFLNPIYYSGNNADSAAAYPNSMYFNGNDAVTLDLLGFGPIDLIGKIGDDPGNQAGWADADGNYWTKDHTLIRKQDVLQGTGQPIEFDPTLEWDSLPKNTFTNLGFHDCDCNMSNLEDLNHAFKVYPNPVQNDYIYIQSNYSIQEYKLYNSIGKVVFQNNISDLTEFKLSAKNLKPGIYFITIENTFGRETKSFVIK